MKNVIELSKEDRHRFSMWGMNDAQNGVSYDYHMYQRYKNDPTFTLTKEEAADMSILLVLEELGYPMEEIGTYLYKDVVVKATKKIGEFIANQDGQALYDLADALNDGFSPFYHDLARNDRDMALKSFHVAIEEAHAKKVETTSSQILAAAYPTVNTELNYGQQAFLLGSYIVRSCNFTPEQQSKRLNPNLPTGKRLTKELIAVH